MSINDTLNEQAAKQAYAQQYAAQGALMPNVVLADAQSNEPTVEVLRNKVMQLNNMINDQNKAMTKLHNDLVDNQEALRAALKLLVALHKDV